MSFEMPKYHHSDFTRPEFVNAPDVKYEIAQEGIYMHCRGFVAGNALATHDLEGALLHMALGQDIYTQVSQPNCCWLTEKQMEPAITRQSRISSCQCHLV